MRKFDRLRTPSLKPYVDLSTIAIKGLVSYFEFFSAQQIDFLFCFRSLRQRWTQSVPPRGSGWVRRLKSIDKTNCVPTRYHEAVLTASNFHCGRGHSVSS